MSQQTNGIYEFDLFRLDAQELLLQHDSVTISLTPKAFDLLLALVGRHGRLVENEELFKAVWPETIVAESNLSSNIALIRQALVEGGSGLKFIAAVAQRGYRFVAQVREVKGAGAPVGEERIEYTSLEEDPAGEDKSGVGPGFALEGLSAQSGSRLEGVGVGPLRLVGQARLAWAVAAALLLGLLGLTWAYFTRQPITNEARGMKFSILPPGKSSFDHIALSPDGKWLAFTAATDGKVQLWVRALDSTEAKPLAGTQGAHFPFWSPDSRFIGFFANNQLKKIEFTGGLAQPLCEVVGLPFGGAWSRAGVILFARAGGNGLSRISATGGEVIQVTTPDRLRQEISHRYPTFLPDGCHFLYSIHSGQKGTLGVYLGSLDEKTLKRRLLDDFTTIKYMAAVPGDTANDAGWLVFGRNDELVAQPFDARRLDFTGEPFSLSAKVGSDLVAPNYYTFSVSGNGVLVFDPSLKQQRRQYLWVDRRGQQIKSLDVPSGNTNYSLSPDEKRFIAARPDPQTLAGDLWLYDVSGDNAQHFTFDQANDWNPVWAPDGGSIVWVSDRGEGWHLYQKAASGAGEETPLLKSDHPISPTDWSRDGRFIIYRQDDPKTKGDVWFLPVTGSSAAKPVPIIQTEANEGSGTLSPDGRWLAYTSDESGRIEVYVQSFPGGGSKRQVSSGGGNHPRWRRDGRELFYYAGGGKLMAPPVKSGESLEVGEAASLFEFRAGAGHYAVTADGQRFLINAVVEMEPNAPLTVWTNWTAGMKK